jgi:hypothetical protein
MIEDHPVFLNTLCNSQNPVSVQLVIGLFQFVHNGNADTVEAIAQYAGVSAGTVGNCMCRVSIYLINHTICAPPVHSAFPGIEYIHIYIYILLTCMTLWSTGLQRMRRRKLKAGLNQSHALSGETAIAWSMEHLSIYSSLGTMVRLISIIKVIIH